ncbi:hypothetical protein FZEAL_4492 [Fusarium zealandicum]|uniref:Uncharacterized protein n=1 Tax=Fusarium zealandicum TaxID=1053134 RepID=A0A8H4XKS0_9HYPO|nr:hypothetical protein FZEAL_4492 [Fusarium zealandicum]
MEGPHHASNLQYLELKECIVYAPGLKIVLTRCPNLLGLLMELGDVHGDGYGLDRESWEVDLNEFGRSLIIHGRNLVEFELHTVIYQAGNGIDGRFGSLRELESLKHLRIIPCGVLGSKSPYDEEGDEEPLALGDTLPQVLETLHLYCE